MAKEKEPTICASITWYTADHAYMIDLDEKGMTYRNGARKKLVTLPPEIREWVRAIRRTVKAKQEKKTKWETKEFR